MASEHPPPPATFDPSLTHIAYLHAWPLIGKLGTGDPFPIKKLDFESERALLFNTLNQANRRIRLQMEVATSDNLLRLITMGCRAIHYTGHGMPSCFPEAETRVLTNRGFLDLGQLEKLQAQNAEVLYACYDIQSRTFVYRPAIGDLIVRHHDGEVVDFTPAQDQCQWDASAPAARESKSASNQLSLRVTPDHWMYVQRRDTADGASHPHAKIKASTLLPGREASPTSIRQLTCAEEGVGSTGSASLLEELRAQLSIETEEQAAAFFELYGWWLGAGSIDTEARAVQFATTDSTHPTQLQLLLQRVGLQSGEFDIKPTNDGSVDFAIHTPMWWMFFSSPSARQLWRSCGKQQLRRIIHGLQQVSSDASFSSAILTASVSLRDDAMIMLLHGGYTAHFQSHPPPSRPSSVPSWRIEYADSSDELASHPTLDTSTDVRSVDYSGRVWCVQVDHPDHLIVAQRTKRDGANTIIRASRPVLVGQCLAFEDDEGKMHPMDPAQLKELVEAGRSTGASRTGIEFVFVSACHSESAGLAFVAAGVPHVIAVKTEAAVCDRASQVFMNHFYLALLVGKTVRASFDIGQKAVRHNPRLNGGDEPRKFLLLPESADHERTLFSDIPPGRWTDASAPPVPHTIPAIPENFLGRNFLIQKVIACLSKKRLVTLTGARGIGKTSVAVAAARYIWKRSHFDGVFMVDLRKLLAHDDQQQRDRHDDRAETNTDGAHTHATTHHPQHRAHNLSSLVSQACQTDEHRQPAKLFRALQSIPRLLLVFDGADCILKAPEHESVEGEGEGAHSSSGVSQPHHQHDLRGFISDFLRSVPGSKVLVTSVFALAGIQDVVEAQLEVRTLAPIDAAQLFYDLRPREIELAEFGCDDPKKAASKLSEHPALKMLAGHPRRIFNAVPCLREVKMGELTAIIEGQIKREQRLEHHESQQWMHAQQQQQQHQSTPAHHAPHHTPRSASRTHTPEPHSHSHHPSSSMHHAPPASQAQDLFDHNLYLWFGGHGSARPLPESAQHAWSESTAAGVHFWRSSFGRVEVVPWNETTERVLNHQFMAAIGSHERPLESLDLRTLQTKLESLGSPSGYLHVQVFGAFWRDWSAFCETIRKILPYWTCQAPTRIIHGWCNRNTCTNLLIESIHPQTGLAVHRPIGTFVLRMSESQVGSIAVGFVDQTNKILHTLITTKGSDAHGTQSKPAHESERTRAHFFPRLVVLFCIFLSDNFLLNLTDGGRSYTSLSDLLLQCRPFVSLYPGIDKLAVLAPGDQISGEGMPALGGAGHSNLSGQFQSFPNAAGGGGVGLFSPPPPGSHGGGGFFPDPLARLPLTHAQSAFSPAHPLNAAVAAPGAHPPSRLPHPHSFPSMSGLGAALPVAEVAHSNRGEGEAPPGQQQPTPEGHRQSPSPPGGIK